ncbi:unnamed protein product [Rotaria sordida]|uniref:Uncharacterized protein n=2 Tax=Rotaria sordida TaxID=392033 RepID=A0A814D197_9BILA|nr:unnamed protein product [Rotaria sordida]
MMVTNNIIGFLFILLLCIVNHKTSSFENNEQITIEDLIMKPYLVKATSSLIDQHPSIDKIGSFKIRSSLENAHSESGEKYFNWVRKTQRPMEFLRGKRQWFFTKKNKSDKNVNLMPNIKT